MFQLLIGVQKSPFIQPPHQRCSLIHEETYTWREKEKGVGWGCTKSYKGIKVGALYEVYDSTTLNKSLSHIEYNLVWLFFFFFFFFFFKYKSNEID
jgi:hypothetical protein